MNDAAHLDLEDVAPDELHAPLLKLNVTRRKKCYSTCTFQENHNNTSQIRYYKVFTEDLRDIFNKRELTCSYVETTHSCKTSQTDNHRTGGTLYATSPWQTTQALPCSIPISPGEQYSNSV